MRPRSAEKTSGVGESMRTSNLPVRSDLEASATDGEDLERASKTDLSEYAESESVDISAPYRDKGIRSGL